MYDRAPRILTRPTANTAPNVGPGTYYPAIIPHSESYAPFQSMSVRESFLTISEGVAAAPGPGHYSPLKNSSSIKGGCSLGNRSNRFQSSPSITPGPGTYKVSSQWPQKVHSISMKDSKLGQIKFKRQGNAPSIPSSGCNNGYEEDINGTLKPQDMPLTDETLGPAYYDLPHMDTVVLQNYKGVHFGKLSSNRSSLEGHEGPGPGDYSPSMLNNSRRIASSNFLPNSIPRYHELITKQEDTKGVPGPGRYELKSQFKEKSSHDPESEKAPFGSRLQRFLDEKQSSPACTTYQDPRSALSTINKLHGMKRTPFSQSSRRFKTNRHDDILPGPGSYNDAHATGMTSQLMRKVISNEFKQCPFGTTSIRTVPLTKKNESQMPGPADYQDSEVKNQKSNTHAFGSTTSRIYSPAMDNPPPGSYEVSKAFTSTQGKIDTSAVKTGFLSTLERFAPPRDIPIEEPDMHNPGPGKYEEIDQRKHQGGVIGMEQPRLKKPQSTTPGPGTYQLSQCQRDTLLQGTYNITLANPLSKERKSTEHKENTSVLIGV